MKWFGPLAGCYFGGISPVAKYYLCWCNSPLKTFSTTPGVPDGWRDSWSTNWTFGISPHTQRCDHNNAVGIQRRRRDGAAPTAEAEQDKDKFCVGTVMTSLTLTGKSVCLSENNEWIMETTSARRGLTRISVILTVWWFITNRTEQHIIVNQHYVTSWSASCSHAETLCAALKCQITTHWFHLQCRVREHRFQLD